MVRERASEELEPTGETRSSNIPPTPMVGEHPERADPGDPKLSIHTPLHKPAISESIAPANPVTCSPKGRPKRNIRPPKRLNL